MRINFRQGLVTSKVSTLGEPTYLSASPHGVMLNGAEIPLVFSLSHGTKNYTISINASFVAWPTRLFDNVNEAWLYIDVNRASAAITYGITSVEPAYGPTAPVSPTHGAMWFNTAKFEHNVYDASIGRWLPCVRVIAGHFTAVSLNEVSFGSQVGITGNSVASGQIVYDGLGRALLDSSGRFFTTEDVILISGVESHAAKLESNVVTGTAAQYIPAYHTVRFNADGDIVLADYDDVGDSVIGMSIADSTPGTPVNIVLSGLVHNTTWTWAKPNLTLWVNQAGKLVTTDPYLIGGRAKPRVPVARTIDKHTIIFDQGMGGVGEKGDTGDISNISLASLNTMGITKLSVDPEDFNEPIAVGTNDPRLTDPRLPLEHTHAATAVTVSPFGTFNGSNAQQALEHLQTSKLNLSGGTLTGNVISTVQATQDDHLVTFGQAKAAVTAAAVTVRRYSLSNTANTIVQAFNELSSAQRNLAVNTLVFVQWRDDVFAWAGGYGTPVTATDDAQFIWVGKINFQSDGTVNIKTFTNTMVHADIVQPE